MRPAAVGLFFLSNPMKLLHERDCELIAGGAPLGNITTTVNTSVGPTTVTSNASVVTKPKITTKAGVANQLNVSVQNVALAGVNSSFSASQASAQINDLTV